MDWVSIERRESDIDARLFQLSSFNSCFFNFQTGKESMRGDKGMGGCYQRSKR
jgi:hypothetical protein